jgi:hypothetical protein
LGGKFGGFGRKKSQPAEPPPASPDAPAAAGAGPGSLLEMTTELSSFSSASVSDAEFAIPAGFKKVESDLKRMK